MVAACLDWFLNYFGFLYYITHFGEIAAYCQSWGL